MEVTVVKWTRILTIALYSHCLLQSALGGSIHKPSKKKQRDLQEKSHKLNTVLDSHPVDFQTKVSNSKYMYSGKGESTSKTQEISEFGNTAAVSSNIKKQINDDETSISKLTEQKASGGTGEREKITYTVNKPIQNEPQLSENEPVVSEHKRELKLLPQNQNQQMISEQLQQLLQNQQLAPQQYLQQNQKQQLVPQNIEQNQQLLSQQVGQQPFQPWYMSPLQNNYQQTQLNQQQQQQQQQQQPMFPQQKLQYGQEQLTPSVGQNEQTSQHLQTNLEIQKRQQQLMELLRQRYNLNKSAQNAVQISGMTTSPLPALPVEMDQKVQTLLQKVESQQQETQQLLNQAQNQIALNTTDYDYDTRSSENDVEDQKKIGMIDSAINAKNLSMLLDDRNLLQGSPERLTSQDANQMKFKGDIVNTQSTNLNFLKDDFDLAKIRSSVDLDDNNSSIIQNDTSLQGDKKRDDDDDWYFDPDSKTSKEGSDIETNDDYYVSGPGMEPDITNSEQTGVMGNKETEESAIATEELHNILDNKSNTASGYLMWIKARKNYLESPVSMLVIYSWLGCFTLIIISSLMVMKHGHRIIGYVRKPSPSRYHRDSMHATEEARVLCQNVEVY